MCDVLWLWLRSPAPEPELEEADTAPEELGPVQELDLVISDRDAVLELLQFVRQLHVDPSPNYLLPPPLPKASGGADAGSGAGASAGAAAGAGAAPGSGAGAATDASPSRSSHQVAVEHFSLPEGALPDVPPPKVALSASVRKAAAQAATHDPFAALSASVGSTGPAGHVNVSDAFSFLDDNADAVGNT